MFSKEREFIVDEMDVTKVLNIINEYRSLGRNMSVGNCGWGDGEETKWFITFYATDRKYGKIIKDLLEIGELKTTVRPNEKYVDLYFESYKEVESE